MKLSGAKKARVKQYLFDAQGGLCIYCKRQMLIEAPCTSKLLATFDHIVPIHHGGTWAKTNLILACRRCNHYKGCAIIPNWLWQDAQTLQKLFVNRQLHKTLETQ